MTSQILVGNVLDKLTEIPTGSVDCVVTSPPYWGLRDYGVEGQIGLEETPDEYIDNLIEVFEGVRRVLRYSGTLWLNLGDSYAGGGTNKSSVVSNSQGSTDEKVEGFRGGYYTNQKRFTPKAGCLKDKDLIGIPWRIALALQHAGWYLRQDIIWAKPNPMPEAVSDRCTKAHEYLFLLTKSKDYYFNKEAIDEEASYAEQGRGGSDNRYNENPGLDSRIYNRRNKRSVWWIKPTKAKFKGTKHFATFPEELVQYCLRAGCREGGTVLDPFAGSGVVGKVANWTNRKSILVELNPEYAKIIEQKIQEPLIRL